jgi:monoterpene epsilon-lactone hydrolase
MQVSAALVACCFVSLGPVENAMAQKPVEARAETSADPDGTLHVPALSIPPSEFWSDEFRASFAAMAERITAHRSYKQPLPTAPKAEWDSYDSECDRSHAPTLDWQRAHYPVDVVENSLGGVRTAAVTPKGGPSAANKDRILIELRGGSCGGLVGLAEAIPVAHFGKIRVVAVDFRPAPRHKFPASIDDVVAVYEALLKQHKPSTIGIFGTSGGGMLASQVLAALQRKGTPQPGAVGIFWAGLTDHPYPFGKFGDSLMWELGGVPRADHTEYRNLITQLSGYMSDVPANDPVGYPGSSDEVLRKFPPTLILTGTRALDMSAAVASHRTLSRLGVNASLYVMEGGWHAASYGTRGSAEEIDVNTYIGKWFADRLAR